MVIGNGITPLVIQNTPGFKSAFWNRGSLPTEPNQSWSVNTPSAGSDYVMG